ncbi:uncharacterized protein LOC135928558 [Gordionus sp. m RMFG-2023]|uniref:uncharacterized protein LOC135928558 n=1 Tax=Gordionus sp. m RMFG-2023 TaxID=3053472 RepID=UPI0031FCEE78
MERWKGYFKELMNIAIRKDFLPDMEPNISKGDPLEECGNYRGIKLTCHSLKLMERILVTRLKNEVEISANQFGFVASKSTIDPIFALRQMMDKYGEKKRNIHMFLIDLEKAYDTVPRNLIWWCLRKQNIPDAYLRLMKNIYEALTSCVRTTDLKAIWCMLYADDIVLCEETKEKVFEEVEKCSKRLARYGLKVNNRKTVYMEMNVTGTPSLDDKLKYPKVDRFIYLGSMLHQEGACGLYCGTPFLLDEPNDNSVNMGLHKNYGAELGVFT